MLFVLLFLSVEQWKTKWRTQRDTFVRKRRELKTTKSGQAAKKTKPWKYMDIMSFLDAFTEEAEYVKP